MSIVPNQISCCLDCVHPIDESGQCIIAKMFEKPVNPEHGCSWRVPIKRKAVLTNAELIDKKRTEAKVFLIARFFIDRPDQEVELVKAVIHRCCEEIGKQPAIEAEPVRHGRWEKHADCLEYCTNCSAVMSLPHHKFCGNCGARMDGGADS